MPAFWRALEVENMAEAEGITAVGRNKKTIKVGDTSQVR